ncbi:MAG TPA: ATP-binding cassette domain-containing protein, partial [archaeon]|nr:ATP-binding cassette domain-containing protein [archaeon]
ELWDRKNELVKNFSGGMKRRLEIARGLLHYPKVLFLDEPTVGLDPQTRNHIWDYIKKVNKREGTTIFFTTHYMDEAERYADSIAIIDYGKIIDIGTSKELIKKTKTNTLEEAFIKITGYSIRDEEVSTIDRMRQNRKMHHK